MASTIVHCFLLLAFISSIFSVNIERESKEFIQLLIENCDSVAICSSRPVAAFPRTALIRTRVRNTPRAFLVPDVLLWDPLPLFPSVCLLCPSCSDQSVLVRPIRWKDGESAHDQPRLIYGLRSDVVLVRYICERTNTKLWLTIQESFFKFQEISIRHSFSSTRVVWRGNCFNISSHT